MRERATSKRPITRTGPSRLRTASARPTCVPGMRWTRPSAPMAEEAPESNTIGVGMRSIPVSLVPLSCCVDRTALERDAVMGQGIRRKVSVPHDGFLLGWNLPVFRTLRSDRAMKGRVPRGFTRSFARYRRYHTRQTARRASPRGVQPGRRAGRWCAVGARGRSIRRLVATGSDDTLMASRD